jgi:enoyl-[acyl-carrier-protein] reductase (NADH)
VYIADLGNQRIRKVTVSTGIITTIAGNGGTGSYSGDNGPATSAEFYDLYGVAVDLSGNVYTADTRNHRIRKITISSGIITTIAGSSTGGGYSGDNGQATAATLNYPHGVAVDLSGNMMNTSYYMELYFYFCFT